MGRFDLESLTEYSDGAVLDEIRRVAQLHSNGPFTLAAYKRLSPRVSANTIRRRFGDWTSALHKAGLGRLGQDKFLTPYQQRLNRGRTMTNDELIDEMRRVHELVGRAALTKEDFNRFSVTCYDAVRIRFGRWHEALEKAGIERSSAGKRYTDEQCFENMASLWNHYGRQPRYHEANKAPSTVGSKAYINRWRGWRRALKAFVDWANADNASIAEAGAPNERSRRSVSSERAKAPSLAEERREIPLRLKWQVHVRDRFRCVACGRTPSEHGVTLHVDHIDPWADGGKTVLENLQTLCSECNLAKGKSFIDVRGHSRGY